MASALAFRTYSPHVGEFSLFTDNKNALYMLSPTRFNANVAQHIVRKTKRWALRLSEFNFTVEHIPGAFNTWADLLTRWAAPGNEESSAQRLSALRVPLITADLPELPSLDVIYKSQLASPPPSDSGCSLTSNLGTDVWMDDELQLRISVAAHCGLGVIEDSQLLPTLSRKSCTGPRLTRISRPRSELSRLLPLVKWLKGSSPSWTAAHARARV